MKLLCFSRHIIFSMVPILVRLGSVAVNCCLLYSIASMIASMCCRYICIRRCCLRTEWWLYMSSYYRCCMGTCLHAVGCLLVAAIYPAAWLCLPIACSFELSFVYFIEVLCCLTEPPPFYRKCRKSAVECGHCACVWNARLLRVLAHFIFSLSSHQRNAVVAQCFIIPRANVHVAITQDLSLDHPDLLCL